MKKILDFFGSVRLTLGLLLGLSLVSVVGTIKPAEPGRFELYYQTPWFRLLLALLAINLMVCTWRTLRRALGADRRLQEALAKRAWSASGPQLPVTLSAAQLQSRCAALGYPATAVEGRVLATRGRWSRWTVPVLHLSILAIMFGALAGELGFVGTLNIYVGHQSDRYFDWGVEREEPLEFTFRLDHFEPKYYPIDLRFATIDPISRETLEVYTTREGETVDLGHGLSVTVARFFPEEEHLVLQVLRDGIPVGEYHALSGQRNYPNAIRLEHEIRPVAFRDPLLKQLYSEVSILEEGQVVRQGVIEVNRPLVHRGVAIYQTTYNRDESGFWTCGYQFSRDPGEVVVWVASILLCLALLLVFTIRPQALGLVQGETGWQAVVLTGFRGEAGRDRLESLVERLQSEGCSPTDER